MARNTSVQMPTDMTYRKAVFHLGDLKLTSTRVFDLLDSVRTGLEESFGDSAQHALCFTVFIFSVILIYCAI
jgi:hypothetical protein